MQQLESDLDQTQEKLMTANQRLEEKEKALQNAEGNFFSNFFLKWRNGILLPKLFWPTYCEKKIVIVIEKNFWNSRLKAENFQNFWDH